MAAASMLTSNEGMTEFPAQFCTFEMKMKTLSTVCKKFPLIKANKQALF